MAMTRTREIIAGPRDHAGPAGFFTRPDVAGQGISLVWAQYLIEAGAFYTDGTWQQMVGRLYRPGQKWDVRVLTLLFRGLEEAKWSRRQSMARILRKILDDEDLTGEEQEEMDQELDGWDDESVLKPHTMTQAQRVAFLFGRLFAGGKERVRRFFAFKNGQIARELAEAYFAIENTSLAGNNRRVLTAILDQITPELQERFGTPLQVANIACGCLRLERALAHRTDLEFHSSDLCGAMLEVGKSRSQP
jgi:superfamily II DNA or RNA helicase